MPKPKTFEEQYPAITDFTQSLGRIEIGLEDVLTAFVRAYDEGGTVYEGKDSYPSMEAALQDLETALQAYLDERGL